MKKQLNFHVDERVHKNLSKLAAKEGVSVTRYAQMLFEAAYSNKCEIYEDDSLATRIKRVMLLHGAGEKIAEIAKQIGLSKSAVEQILLAWETEMRGLKWAGQTKKKNT